jgi:predicted O-methyltransferase YrrM
MNAIKITKNRLLFLSTLIIALALMAVGVVLNQMLLVLLGTSFLIIPLIILMFIAEKLIRKAKDNQNEMESKLNRPGPQQELMNKIEKMISRGFERQTRDVEAIIGVYSFIDRPAIPLTLMQDYGVGPEFAHQLILEILKQNPKAILDIGSGLSSILSGLVLKKTGQGHVYSLEHSDIYADKTRQNIGLHGLEDWVTLIRAPLKTYDLKGKQWLWYDLEKLPKEVAYDLVIVDGPPGTIQNMARYPAFPLIFDRFNAGAVLMVDDADRPEDQQIISQWKAEYKDLEVTAMKTRKGLVILKKKQLPD